MNRASKHTQVVQLVCASELHAFTGCSLTSDGAVLRGCGTIVGAPFQITSDQMRNKHTHTHTHTQSDQKQEQAETTRNKTHNQIRKHTHTHTHTATFIGEHSGCNEMK